MQQAKPPLQRFGHYLLLHQLASGGMAEILLAIDERADDEHQLVVIKRIHRHLGEDAKFVDMFLDEERVLKRLHHPNIVARRDFGQIQGAYYIVLEHVWGESLFELTRLCAINNFKFPASASLYIAGEIAAGLSHAHQNRDDQGRPTPIIHRDVTLSNVVVSFEGDVKIVDFGIAKTEGRLSETDVGTLKGTVAYLAPEQVTLQQSSTATDVYQLGVLLYHLLVGRPPYAATSIPGQMQAIESGEIIPPRRDDPNFPEYLTSVLMKAMALRPQDRYGSVAELGNALKRLIRPVAGRARAQLAATVTRLSGERKLQQLQFIEQLVAGKKVLPPSGDLFGWASQRPEQSISAKFKAIIDHEALDATAVARVPVGRGPVSAPETTAREPAERVTVAEHTPQRVPRQTTERDVPRQISGINIIDPGLQKLRADLKPSASASFVFTGRRELEVTEAPLAAEPETLPRHGELSDWKNTFVASDPGDEQTAMDRARQSDAASQPAAPDSVVSDTHEMPPLIPRPGTALLEAPVPPATAASPQEFEGSDTHEMPPAVPAPAGDSTTARQLGAPAEFEGSDTHEMPPLVPMAARGSSTERQAGSPAAYEGSDTHEMPPLTTAAKPSRDPAAAPAQRISLQQATEFEGSDTHEMPPLLPTDAAPPAAAPLGQLDHPRRGATPGEQTFLDPGIPARFDVSEVTTTPETLYQGPALRPRGDGLAARLGLPPHLLLGLIGLGTLIGALLAFLLLRS